MLHPDTELRLRDKQIGYGVFATAPIPKGTITWALDPLDQILTAERVEQFDDEFAELVVKYSYVNGRGERVLCWDFARFMNHSCDANTFSPGLQFEIAVRDIECDEELTSDYGSLNIEREFRCICRSRRCRGVVRDEDFERLARRWDLQLSSAAACMRDVRQPLFKWLHAEPGIAALFAHPDRLPSILAHRWRAAASMAPARRRAAR